MLVKLFVTVVRPTLEYCNSVWGPSLVHDQRKIEKVQHRATRLLLPIRDKPYGERLSILQLPSLAYSGCFRGDMILLYKILNNYLVWTFLHYIPTQILPPLEHTSLNYLSIAQD